MTQWTQEQSIQSAGMEVIYALQHVLPLTKAILTTAVASYTIW